MRREFKRHAIELHEDRVVLDCKGKTSEIIFDDIWEFKVVKSDSWNTKLTIKGKKRKLEFPINLEEADGFAASLLKECPHAVYQDAMGETHLPPVTERPEAGLESSATTDDWTGDWLCAGRSFFFITSHDVSEKLFGNRFFTSKR